MLIDPVIVFALILMLLFMAALWIYQQTIKEADIVDVGWTIGLGLVGVLYSISLPGYSLRQSLIILVLAFWSLRLSTFLIRNRVVKKGEDSRYSVLRRKWGNKAGFYFFLYFQAQALLIIILSSSFYIAVSNPTPEFQIWDSVALSLFLISICGETVADKQLAAFRKIPDNKGRTYRHGLWRFSRHPNYFFEWLHWWTYFFFSIGSDYLIFSLISPALILYLMLYVTGIPPAEAQAVKSRGDNYKEYQETTNAFFPWFPKESKSRKLTSSDL